VSTDPTSPIEPSAAPAHQTPGSSRSSARSSSALNPSGIPNAHAHRVAAYTIGTATATHVATAPHRASGPGPAPTRDRRCAAAAIANSAPPAMHTSWLTTGQGTCDAIVTPSGHPNGSPATRIRMWPIATSGR
jgi:hypothetical protein